MTGRRLRRDCIQLLGPLLPDVVRGLRAGVVMLVPFYFAKELGRHELVWMALGGWFGTLADAGGPRALRFRVIAAFAVTAAVIVAIADVTVTSAGRGLVLLAVVGFTGALLRAIGPISADIGVLLTIVSAVAVGSVSPHPAADAFSFITGAACAIALSSIALPIWKHQPLRSALSDAFGAMASYASAIERAVARGVPHCDPSWASLARRHQRRVRAAIECARSAREECAVAASGEHAEGSNLRALVGSVETQLAMLVALAEELASTRSVGRSSALTSALRCLEKTYRAISGCVAIPFGTWGTELGRTERAFACDGSWSATLAQRLVASTETCVRMITEPAIDAELPREQARHRAPTRVELRQDLCDLRDALSAHSPYLHHAIRVTFAVTAAQLAGVLLSRTHAPWVTVTATAVLQPYPGATVKRAIERGAGTLAGSLLALALTSLIREPMVVKASLLPLSIAAVATRPRSHHLFTLFVTPVFVVLAMRWEGDWWTTAERAADATLGAFIAVVAALVLPHRELKRLSAALDDVLRALRRYAEVVVEAQLAGGAGSHKVARARREVGISLGAAETSLERVLSEPRHPKAEAENATRLLTRARMLGAAFTALDAQLPAQTDDRALRGVLAYVLRLLDRTEEKETIPVVTTGSGRFEALTRILDKAEQLGATMMSSATPLTPRAPRPA